ncbi:FAD-dependent oxidoreductase [Elstera litoralis]|uniref:FAD-dependent oxidoreductase n=1 Tax=Elstera litoralis TaxID=552518 RepID=UPI000696E096|nr:FAD-dependent oxidoreductase [Elstera litoralis]
MDVVDFLVIGAGISGASAAYELAAAGETWLLEAEDQPGYHSTGRSAALYTANFGTPLVRSINAAGFDFFTNPPEGFTDIPLVTPRGALTLAKPGHEAALAALIAQSSPAHPIVALSHAEAVAKAPMIRPETFTAAAFEAGVLDMDVDALHQAYLRGFKRRGGQICCTARVTGLARVAACGSSRRAVRRLARGQLSMPPGLGAMFWARWRERHRRG